MLDTDQEIVEIYHGGQKYSIKKSDAEDPFNGVVLLPTGVSLDLRRMHIDTTDRHGNPLPHPRFAGTNSEYKVSGALPQIGIIKVQKEEEFTELSEKARTIFAHFESHFPSGPYNRTNWLVEGKVFWNTWFDLRKASERDRFEKALQNQIGFSIGTLSDPNLAVEKEEPNPFSLERLHPIIQKHARLLHILRELAFQIDTLDLVEG